MSAPLERRMNSRLAEIEAKAALARKEKLASERLKKVERVGDWANLLRDALRNPIKLEEGELWKKMPKDKRPTLDDLKHHGYFMNIWNFEPVLLDALLRVKEEKTENRIQLWRGLIRSASWATHKPVNPEVAKQDAQIFLEEAQERESGVRHNPFVKQTGFGFEEEAEAKGWQQVLEEVGTMDCKGDRVEAATDFVEKIFVKEWKKFLGLYHEKGVKRTWPDRGIDVKLEPEVKAATDRIVKLREIRDQLYYQRLFPKLCEFGHEGIKKRSA